MNNKERFNLKEVNFNSIEESINTIKILTIKKKSLQLYKFLYSEAKIDYYLSFNSNSTRNKEGQQRQKEITQIIERFINYCFDMYKDAEFETPKYKSNLIWNVYKSITTKAKVKKGKVKMSNQKGKWVQDKEELGAPKKHAQAIYCGIEWLEKYQY